MGEPRILIVDDSKIDRMMLNRAFATKGDGPTLSEAESAADALSQLAEASFDAVFLDINMPGENGFFVLRNLREQTDGTWPLIFMLSSSRHPDDVTEAYSGRATAYLSKPCSLQEMRDIAASCLRLINETAAMTEATRH